MERDRARPPAARSALIGRDEQLRNVLALLSGNRLVSVVGVGGVGKTRLAAAIATAAAGVFGDGVFWVDLAGVSAPASVGEATGRALGLREVGGQDPILQVIEAVGTGAPLLVLDNCEHLVDDVAEFADQLVAACPRCVLLCTSREALGVEGELVHPLTPLPVPRAEERDPEVISGYPAVRLLLDRAALARPGFTLTERAAAAAVRICRRVDGLPLGIELAAARLRVLTLQQIADALDDVFQLLVGGTRRGPSRHRSLRAALDWSHALLTAPERVLLRRLAVFPASFTLSAAEAVAGAEASGPGGAAVPTLDLLSRLIDKSLLTVSHEGDQARYRLLHVVREYARELLDDADEARAAGDAHLLHYTAFAQAQAGLLEGAGAEAALDRLDAERDNLDAAVRHATRHRHPLVLPLGAALWRFCYLRGHYRQGRHWLEAIALAAPDATGPAAPDAADPDPADPDCAEEPAGADRPAPPPSTLTARAEVLHGAGRLAFLQCDYTPALRALEVALRLYREGGDRVGTAACLQALGGLAREQGRYQRAEELYRESLRISEQDGNHAGAARARNYLAFLAWLQGDGDAAEALARQALDAVGGQGDHELAIWALLNLGCAALYRQDLVGAAAVLDDAARLSGLVAFREGQAWTDHLRGLLALRRGDATAGPLLRSALDGHQALGDRWRAASVYADLAAVHVDAEPGLAARLLGRADALWEEIGSGPAPCERGEQEATRAAAVAALGEAGYAQAWHQGRVGSADLPGRRPALPSAQPAAAPATPSAQAPSARSPSARSPSAQAPSAQPPSAQAPSAQPPSAQAPSARPLEILAFGAPVVRVAGRDLTPADWGYGKPRELLFLLACSPPLSKDQLGDRLWPDLGPQQLRNALHTALRGLRKALEDPGRIRFDAGRYSLDPGGPLRFDVADFERALATARAVRDPRAALTHLRTAIELYTGDLLPSSDAEWVQARREGLRRAYTAAAVRAGRILGELGRHQEAAELFERVVRHDPLLEMAHRELMLSWARAGEPARAARQYQALESRLKTELGVAPAAETRILFQRLTRTGDNDPPAARRPR